MAFFKKDYFYGKQKVEKVEKKEEVTVDAISAEADDIRVTSLMVGTLRGILKNANAWKHDNLIEYIATLTDDDKLAESIIGDVEIILETLLGDNPNASEAVENVINGEDDDYIDGLDIVDNAIEDDIDIETLVASYGYFVEETLDSVEEFEVDEEEETTLDSTAFASLARCKDKRFDKNKQKCYRSAKDGKPAYRRRRTTKKELRPYQKNAHSHEKTFSEDIETAQALSMVALGYWDKNTKPTDKLKKKMGLKKRKDGTWGKPKKRGSTKKTPKTNRG